jgi:rSAM/selenodomain-associated transferase 1
VSRDVLMVFLKRPRPGEVKTRLAPALGPELAAGLYRALAEAAVRATRPARDEYRRLFFFAPAEARAEMEAWMPGESWLPQEDGDLGARMAAAFHETFRRGAERVAIVGSDAPWVTRDTVLEALEALDSHDVALGPASDGGYYLLALRREQPEIFQEIPWSTPGVLALTLERILALGRSARVLDVLPDLDTPDDLRANLSRLGPLLDPALLAAVERALAGPSQVS